MKSTSKTIASSAAAVLRFALVAMTTSSAHAGEYCFSDASPSGMLNCDFAIMEQCQASASGRAGTRERDPFYGSVDSATPINQSGPTRGAGFIL
jgi:hypothetical protein